MSRCRHRAIYPVTLLMGCLCCLHLASAADSSPAFRAEYLLSLSSVAKLDGAAYPDAVDPRIVWASAGDGTVIQLQVDYQAKSCQVRTTANYREIADWFGTSPSISFKPLRHGGQTYLCSVGTSPIILRVDESRGRLVPLVVSDPDVAQNWTAAKSPRLKQPLMKQVFGQDFNRSYVWADRDGDGFPPTIDEIRIFAWQASCFGWTVDNHFNYIFQINNGSDVNNLCTMSPVGWSDQGVPLYDFAARQAVAADPGRNDQNHPAVPNHPHAPTDLVLDDDGNIWGTYNDNAGNPQNATGLLAKWDKNGRVLWRVNHPNPPQRFGRIAGVGHGRIVISEVNGGQEVWDGDGRRVGQFSVATMNSSQPTGGSYLGGALVTIPSDARLPGLKPGEVLLFSFAKDHPVFRIHGMEAP